MSALLRLLMKPPDIRRREINSLYRKFLISSSERNWQSRSGVFRLSFTSGFSNLRNWKYDPNSTKRPVQMAQITADLVYARLAPGVLDELRRLNPKDENGHRKNRHHQWLTPDVGHPVLRYHITGLIYLVKG